MPTIDCYVKKQTNKKKQQQQNLENIMLSERSQKQKATFYASLHRKCPEQANPETENNYWLPGYGRQESEKYGDSLWGDGNILKLNSDDGCTL